jgi:hypothetical protein
MIVRPSEVEVLKRITLQYMPLFQEAMCALAEAARVRRRVEVYMMKINECDKLCQNERMNGQCSQYT